MLARSLVWLYVVFLALGFLLDRPTLPLAIGP
jgi:hypothetical protein